MAKGYALTIGLNAVDPNHYTGWSGALNACEADASDMAAIGESRGFDVVSLLTKQATRAAVLKQIEAFAKKCQPGDLFMLSYSGHGGQLPDLNSDEEDAQDETWCLYDGELVDDQVYAALSAFQPHVRILMFSDSCHSGTVARLQASRAWQPGCTPALETPASVRAMPPGVALRTYRAHKKEYDAVLQDRKLKDAQQQISASVLLISGCQDNQLSMDGTFNGLFTGTLLQVWNSGKFTGDHRRFHSKIVELMPPMQTPNYFWAGKPDLEFETKQVFEV